MKKAEMIITVARKASAAWMELNRYEYELHAFNFEPGEISSFEFTQYCSNDPNHKALLHTWYELDELCRSLNIDYNNMDAVDDVIKDHNDRASQAHTDLWHRCKR